MQLFIVYLILTITISIIIHRLVKYIKKPSHKCDGCLLKNNCVNPLE